MLTQSRSAGLFVMDEFRGNPMLATAEQVAPECPELREIIPFSLWDDFVASRVDKGKLPAVAPGDPAMIQYTASSTARRSRRSATTADRPTVCRGSPRESGS